MKIGVHPLEFWEYTMWELNIKSEMYVEKTKEDAKILAHATRAAIGSAINGSEIKIFDDENNDSNNMAINEIDPDTKKTELDYLKNIFN